ncbi:MAG TPA: T9SS type A sorting domain-containing protein, partial [Ignavibacteriales bacterium]|nr:T9SS type A sorting domain-containing protein [Ignavibacteriales bacterium]
RPMNPGWHLELGLANTTENLEAVYYIKKSGNPSIADTGYIIVFADLWEEEDGYSRGSISKYNTVTRNWSVPDSSFIWVRYYHPVQLGGKVYFIGGQVEGTTCIYCGNELMIYDIEKDSVYYGSPMLKQCDSYAIGTFADSLIYILGGYSYDNNVQGEYNGFLNLAQIYNVNTDTWSYGTPFPGIRRCKINGSISGSTVVLAGGYSEQGDASTVDIGVIDPADPSIINWWQKPFLNQLNLENFPGGKTQGLASGAWFGRDTKAVYFAEGRKIWQYNVSTGVFSEMPEKIYTTDKLSALMPIVRNDSVYLAMIGRDKVTGNITNEWYYIGNDAADPDIANEEEPNLTAPKEYSLLQNYPNPFNPSTKIKYSLREPGHVSLTVYDMLGREVKTLINELMSAGEHEVIFNAGELNLSSGIYLYRIKSGSFIQTKKLMLVK